MMLYFNLLFLFFFIFNEPKEFVEIEVSNIKSTKGVLRIGVYKNKANFPIEDKVDYSKETKITSIGTKSITYNDLPNGTYAFAVYQDLNKNNKLDVNLVGYPTEPFAFSNNIKPRFSAPSFEKCSFVYKGKAIKLQVKLID